MDLDAVIDTLSAYLPAPLVNLLAFGLSSLLALLPDTAHLTDTQSWLPLAVSLLAIYFTLASVYRTVSFGFRAAVFFVKYGALLGVAGALYSYIANPNNGPNATGTRVGRRGAAKTKGTRPKPWDTFEKHTEYNKQYRVHKQVEVDAEEGRRMVQGIMNYVWDAAQRFVVSSVMTPRSQVDEDDGRRRTRAQTKGKARSR
ncbi:hypothetical protein EXIGLDRAFT_755155 [Exidia glandulosa HHB12029]|uniref:Uncharacterized protein n=1 Tax=Exidia glandulosa HHB12029 TaxID=1314781 RepID=A0A165CAU7_EXIGL|nr:hypothetical protein EXIGLDRAFT_755155 [Exidia glandulosa HHB12029]